MKKIETAKIKEVRVKATPVVKAEVKKSVKPVAKAKALPLCNRCERSVKVEGDVYCTWHKASVTFLARRAEGLYEAFPAPVTVKVAKAVKAVAKKTKAA